MALTMYGLQIKTAGKVGLLCLLILSKAKEKQIYGSSVKTGMAD